MACGNCSYLIHYDAPIARLLPRVRHKRLRQTKTRKLRHHAMATAMPVPPDCELLLALALQHAYGVNGRLLSLTLITP